MDEDKEKAKRIARSETDCFSFPRHEKIIFQRIT